jgi:hypothetical protein
MGEIRCSVHFFPKILGNCWLWNQILVLQSILLLPSLAVCQSVFFHVFFLVVFNDHLYPLFDVYLLGLPK